MLLKLVDGEQVVVRTRAHYRALIPAAVNLLVTLVLMSFLLGYINRPTQPAFVQHYSHLGVFLVWTLGLLALLFGTAKPLIGWLNRHTYVTTERIVQKNFVGAAQATVIPLELVSEAQVRISKAQQMGGAGDVVLIHGAFGQHQRTRLKNMPAAEQLQTVIAEELSSHRRRMAAQYAGQPGGWPAPAGQGQRGDAAASFGTGYGY